MMWALSAFQLILLLQCFSATICEQGYTTVTRDWKGGFKGKIKLKITKDVSEAGWTMTLSFLVRTPNLRIWRADIIEQQNDKVYTMVNKPWNKELSAGDVLEMDFIADKSKDGAAPKGKVDFERGMPPSEQPPTPSPSSPKPTTRRDSSSPSPSPGTNRPISTQPAKTTSTKRPTSKPTIGVTPKPGKYNYGEVLKLSILFYEAQRSGKLPKNNRVPWRKDSALNDGKPNGVDLTGGWYDAADYVKFGFPMASSVTVLAWGLLEYKKAYIASGQYDHMLRSIKWATDYFMKAHTKKFEFYGQVGDGGIDHAYWGRPEDMPNDMKRPAWKITPRKPGSDLAAETAAALAASSIPFKAKKEKSSKMYANKLLEHAMQLYAFAEKHRGKYSDSITDANSFYPSSNDEDELVWGAAWLYGATKSEEYFKKAEKYYRNFRMNKEAWAFSWDDKTAGVQLLLAGLTKKKSYLEDIKSSLDKWLPGGTVAYTPKGLAWRDKWGSNRYAANMAFLALVAADYGITPSVYRDFAKKQIHYMLGDSGRSFVVGFGHNPPQRPHHSSSSCPSAPKKCDWSNFHDPKPNAHVLEGALVGGPDENDNYEDDRTNYEMNEVTTDYNAGFQSAVAGLEQLGNS